ncbi:hypothetical protein [Halorubellus salinus]|uniref:hypothetical protein n=1 Tax=Halorubellus salinus TaxID=755309 RepID=UPI001D062659|nr:hypothetical protein [Halorubellus salinus]
MTSPAKRVPKSIGTDAKLFGTYTLTDLAVGLFPAVVLVLLTQLALPPTASVAGYRLQSIALPIAVLAMCLGGIFVYLTPSYTTSLDWITTMLGYRRRPKQHSHDAAKEYTQLERVHEDADAIERTDGAFVGAVQVDPPMLALATDDEWERTATAFAEFLNSTVEFPVQFYSTTHSFPVEEYLATYEARLDDPDVQSNPRLSALIEEYVEWYATELEQRRMTIRDHYVIITIRPEDVQFEHESIVAQVARIPLIGLFVRAIAAPPVETQRAVLADALDERVRRVTAGLRDIDDCSATPVPARELVTLVAEFWHDDDLPQSNLSQRLRRTPIIRRTK